MNMIRNFSFEFLNLSVSIINKKSLNFYFLLTCDSGNENIMR